MTKRQRTILQYLFFLGLGVLFAWLSLKNLDEKEFLQIKNALRDAKHWLIIPVFAILILSHLIRALRWRLLIEPLGYKPSVANSFFAVMIGYITNQAVPRLGEVLKCTVLARYEKIPADKLIGTIILERLIDALTLLVVFGITLAIQPQLYNQIMDAFFNSSKGEEEKKMATWVLGLIILGVIILAIAAWMIIKKKNLQDVFAAVKKIIRSVVQGIAAIRRLKKRRLFIIYTILLWGLYLAGGYIGFMAFRDTAHYGIREAFTVLSAGSIGMIASPGGIGAYAYLLQQTMLLYGLNDAVALAFGWILWLVQTGVIVIGGLFSFVALPYYNKRRSLETDRSYTEKDTDTAAGDTTGSPMESNR